MRWRPTRLTGRCTSAASDVYKGQGHNSIATVVDLCNQVKPDMVAMCHHDPQSTDQMVSNMSADAANRLKCDGSDTVIFAAREGMTVKAHSPKPPLALN